jgi:hypothetical protein
MNKIVSIGIILILIIMNLNHPYVSSNNPNDETIEITLTLMQPLKTKTIEKKITINECEKLINLFQKNKENLEENNIDLLLNYLKEIEITPKEITINQLQSYLSPPWWSKINILKNRYRIQQSSATSIFCNIYSAGNGKIIPFMLLPRPRLIHNWEGYGNQGSVETLVGSIRTNEGFIASGTQNGTAMGFTGLGLTLGLPTGSTYMFAGYAVYAIVNAKEFTYFPPNKLPTITNIYPNDGQENVPIETNELRFSLSDEDNDMMTYSVTTNPNIGTGSGSDVEDGTYSVSISDLETSTTYSWTINIDDGRNTVTKTYSFSTPEERPVVLYPNPPNHGFASTSIEFLEFTLYDAQGDLMDYSVETEPYIGSGGGNNVENGVYTVPIYGLKENIWYHWYVNVTDGNLWTYEEYEFYTGTAGLAAYWSFNEGSGDIAHDLSGYGHDGTIHGATWTSNSVSGYALDFDGTDSDYIEIDNPDGLKFSDESFSLSAWVQLRDNANNYRTFVSLGAQSPSYPSIRISKSRSGFIDGRIFFQIAQNGEDWTRCDSIADGNSLPKNQWMLVTGVADYENNLIHLYIDGIYRWSFTG